MEYNWFKLNEEKRDKWLELCPRDEFRVVEPQMISGLLPDSLVNKYDSVLLLTSGVDNSNAVVFMANGHRVDANDSAIDQMPFGFGYLSDDETTSGLLIQHGSWKERTSTPPPEFWTHIHASGVGTCYPLEVLPTQESGHISDLRVQTQSEAFGSIVEGLKIQSSRLKT